jgi:hypothetical protein
MGHRASEPSGEVGMPITRRSQGRETTCLGDYTTCLLVTMTLLHETVGVSL